MFIRPCYYFNRRTLRYDHFSTHTVQDLQVEKMRMGNHCCFLFILLLNLTASNAIEPNRVAKFSSLGYINEQHLIISGNPVSFSLAFLVVLTYRYKLSFQIII